MHQGEKPPSIVWICTDQQRADSLACYGNPIARTPHIDSIAHQGTRFTRHITPMQICSPSRATMFTGLYPRHHELITNGRALDPKTVTVTQRLCDAGYRTHSVGKQHLQPILAPAACRFPDSRAFWKAPANHDWTGPYYGFQTLDLLIGESDTAAVSGHYANWLKRTSPESPALLKPAAAPEAPPADLDEIWRSAMPPALHYNSWISERAATFIRRADPGQPFFLFVSYPDPHHPFAPPLAYADRYAARDMPLPRVDAGELDRQPDYYGSLFPTGTGFRELYWAGSRDLEAGSMITTAGISDESMQRAIAHTCAMIEMIDDGVGRVLGALADCGLTDDTIVLFTSDHGELLGTHGLLHKGPPPYRQLVEVSLMIKGPDIRSGHVEQSLTNHIDLTPTFLELAGIDADGGLDGMSLMPLLTGNGIWKRQANYGEYHPTVRPELYNQTIRTDGWRLTLYPDSRQWGELFDLGEDPDEHVNRFHDPSFATVRGELSAQLKTEFAPLRTIDNPALCKW